MEIVVIFIRIKIPVCGLFMRGLTRTSRSDDFYGSYKDTYVNIQQRVEDILFKSSIINQHSTTCLLIRDCSRAKYKSHFKLERSARIKKAQVRCPI